MWMNSRIYFQRYSIKQFCLFMCLIVIIGSIYFYAQQDSYSTAIVLTSSVSHTKVPLNRTVELKVTLSWMGDSGKYSVVDFENPSLTNFEITGTSTASRTELIKDQTRVFKEYVFTLKPKELGMGYVDAVNVQVRNTAADSREDLKTQRIPVEVIDPIPEPKERENILITLLSIGIVIVVAGFVIWINRRREKAKHVEAAPPPPIELAYLEELKTQFNLDHPNLHDDFFKLSKLVRRYLTIKYSVRALELTTDKLFSAIEETGMAENQLMSIKKILTRSDEIKFSGTDGTHEELSQFYTLFEGILQSNK